MNSEHASVSHLADDRLSPAAPGPRGDNELVPGVKSVAKAARILRTFEPGRRALTVRDIAARTGLPRSTCHAICTTLAAESLLELLPAGGYQLGPGLVGMGGQVIERLGLVEAANPSMLSLARSTSGEVHLAQLVLGWVVYLTRTEPERRVHMHNRLGLRVPAHLTGCGKAALSQMEPARVRELLGQAGVDHAAAERLLSELAGARARGFVVSGSFQPGVVSVAAALTGPDGTVVGGLSVAQRREALDRRRAVALGTAIRAAALDTSERLRWQSPPGWPSAPVSTRVDRQVLPSPPVPA